METDTFSYSTDPLQRPAIAAGRLRHWLSSVVGLSISGALLIAGVFLAVVFIRGVAWISSILFPWFSALTYIGLGLVVFVFLPLAIPKNTRRFAVAAIAISSYVFGATLWMESLLLTLSLWGFAAAFVGLALGTVGVIPIAIIATVVNGMWWVVLELVLLTIMTVAGLFGAESLRQSVRR